MSAKILKRGREREREQKKKSCAWTASVPDVKCHHFNGNSFIRRKCTFHICLILNMRTHHNLLFNIVCICQLINISHIHAEWTFSKKNFTLLPFYASAYVTYGKIYNKYYYDCLKRLTRIYSMSVKIVFCFFPPNISSTYIYCEFSKIRSSEALGLTSCAYGAVNSSLKTTDVPKNRLIPKFQLMGFPLNEPVSHRTFSMS